MNHDRASPRRRGRGQRPGINQSILRLNNEQLFALDAIDLRPVHRGGAQDVVDADVKGVRSEAFDLASNTVSVFHDDDVILFACK